MSQIRQLYTNLAGMTVSFTTEADGSVTVPCYDLHQLPNSVQAADTPCRLLLPYSSVTNAKNGMYASLDTIGQINWSIGDLLLWKPGALGKGIGQVAADLVRYQGAYAEALRYFKAMGTTDSVVIEGWSFEPGLWNWPIGSDVWFQGVMIQLVVLEEMSS